jgi:hypothetical protein
VTAAPNPRTAPKQAGSTHRNLTAQLGLLGPEVIRAMAEKTVAQTREMFETFGAAGQGAAALNRKIIDLALRNVVSGFELARKLAGAKNLAEIVDLQVAYWQKQLALPAQAEEVRTFASRVSANTVRPTKVHATRRTWLPPPVAARRCSEPSGSCSHGPDRPQILWRTERRSWVATYFWAWCIGNCLGLF